MKYIPRELEYTLNEYLETFSIVGLTGPRQSGKSTLLLHCLKDKYQYITFDAQEVRNDFYDDPQRFMAQYANRVIFDEVQKVPEIFEYIKIAVDKDRSNYGKYILTGSSQFSMIKKITESLAGRIGLLSLLPFQYSEIPKNLRSASIYSGAYPELINQKYRNTRAWYDSYITTYLERDVRELIEIGNMRDFSRFVRLLAANAAQNLNLSTYAGDLGITVSTVKRWLSVLESSYIIFLLSPFYKNYGKRIVKSPKIYFYDTGLVAYLTRNDNKEQFENGPMQGSIFENYIIAQMKKKIMHKKINADLYYYRTSNQVEIDCIVDYGISQLLLEIKSNNTFRPKMLGSIKTILTDKNQAVLVYNGKSREYTNNIKIVNYKEFLDNGSF